MSASRCSIQWPYFPSFIVLFQLFWPWSVLQRIVDETSRYATVVNNDGGTFGGVQLQNHYIVGIDGIHCHHFIHGNETPTKLEILLV